MQQAEVHHDGSAADPTLTLYVCKRDRSPNFVPGRGAADIILTVLNDFRIVLRRINGRRKVVKSDGGIGTVLPTLAFQSWCRVLVRCCCRGRILDRKTASIVGRARCGHCRRYAVRAIGSDSEHWFISHIQTGLLLFPSCMSESVHPTAADSVGVALETRVSSSTRNCQGAPFTGRKEIYKTRM